MSELLFGTAGTPHSTKRPSTANGIERVTELGLGCMEMEFVRRASMGESTAHLVAETAARTGVQLSAHAPYYINLNAREPEKVRASQQRLLQTARIASWCGARSVAFHAAFYLGDPPEQVYRTVKQHLEEVLQQLRQEDLTRAADAASHADLVLSLGSSLSVYPAAAIPLAAAERSIPYVIVNRGPTEHDGHDSVRLRLEGDVISVFPPAVDAVCRFQC